MFASMYSSDDDDPRALYVSNGDAFRSRFREFALLKISTLKRRGD